MKGKFDHSTMEELNNECELSNKQLQLRNEYLEEVIDSEMEVDEVFELFVK